MVGDKAEVLRRPVVAPLNSVASMLPPDTFEVVGLFCFMYRERMFIDG